MRRRHPDSQCRVVTAPDRNIVHDMHNFANVHAALGSATLIASADRAYRVKAMTQQVPLFIDGEFISSGSADKLPVTNPANQQLLAEVPLATAAEVDRAVASAVGAFHRWKEVSVSERARLMMRYCQLLKDRHDELGELLAQDTGKTFEDAKGDVWRGIEVVEQAANVPSGMMGETLENVAGGVDTYSYVQPLGVVAGITPFNFPAMIPLWMFPLAIACGNTFVLKPSEQDPLTPVRLVELFVEAGAPAGVLNMVHGGASQVDQLLNHPDIRAVSFVGSSRVGEHIYRTGTAAGKRVQCMMGAKNHMVVMPDANRDATLNALVGASVGAAGQRCMAISVAPSRACRPSTSTSCGWDMASPRSAIRAAATASTGASANDTAARRTRSPHRGSFPTCSSARAATRP